jgi:predicted RNase H-like nuclease
MSVKWLYGVDGCRGGWIVARSTADLQEIGFSVVPDFDSLLQHVPAHFLVAIDIPIGLPDIGRHTRTCDVEARHRLLWPRRSSVFSPPSRHTLTATNFSEALRLNRGAVGVGLSKQAFYIMPKIREVDVRMSRDMQRYIREVHPEVTFTQLNGGTPMLNAKRTAVGRAERINVLAKAGLPVSEQWLIAQRTSHRAAMVALDDLLDALACLVTAFNIQSSRIHVLGRPDERDAKGLLMEIVTCALNDSRTSANSDGV